MTLAPGGTPVFPFLSVALNFRQEIPTTIATPASVSQTYRLIDWQEQDAIELIRQMDRYAYAVDMPSFCEVRDSFQSAQKNIKLAAKEALLRFPDSPSRRQILWRLALSNVILSNSESDPWILSDLQEGLNSGLYNPEDLNSTLPLLGFQVSSIDVASEIPGIDQMNSISVLNLFGDGRIAYIFELSSLENSLDGFIFALSQDAQGYYHVTPIYSGWDFIGGGGIRIYDISDHTHDGLPEVVVIVDYCNCSCASDFARVYQWRGGQFVDLARGQIEMGSEFSGWKFGPAETNSIETINIMSGGFIYPLITKHLVWDGEWYRLANISSNTPDQEQVQNQDSFDLPGWIDLSLESGQIQEVADSLQPAVNADSIQRNAKYGLSYPDYVKFELGLSYALLSQPDQARQILHSLVISPSNPQTVTVSLATQAFLKNYTNDRDVYQSCLASLDIMEKKIASYRGADGRISQENYLRFWGYSPIYSSNPLCNLRAAFQLLVSQLNQSETVDAVSALRAAGVTVAYSDRLDFNNDGIDDWIVVLATPGSHTGTDIWVLLTTPQGLLALPIEETSSYELPRFPLAQPIFRVEKLSIADSESSFFILQTGDYLYIFRVIHQQGQEIVEQLYRQDLVGKFELLGSEETPEIKMYLKADKYDWTLDPEWVLVRWDAAAETFKVAEQAMLLAEKAETLLLTEKRADEAIPLLQSLLASPNYPGDTCHFNWAPCYPRPYLLYLLGLSYELTGDKAGALNSYWQLWHDYPDSPYAIMAQAKLEPTQP